MPRLDLLSEYELEVLGVLFADGGEYRGVDGVEELLGERTDVVEIWQVVVQIHCRKIKEIAIKREGIIQSSKVCTALGERPSARIWPANLGARVIFAKELKVLV